MKPEDLKALSWRGIGPANMGGRVADIALVPGSSKSFYVAFGTGGLWKTTNAGTTFSSVFDSHETTGIGSVAVADAPENWPGWKDEEDKPKRDELKEKGKGKIVWVGTGEGNGRNSSSWGHGVYRSTDAAGSFKYVGLKETHDIPRLAVDPGNPDVCYVAAMGHLWGPNKERGLYKTDDAGKTWKQVLKIDENHGCIDVVLNPKDPDTVYAAMYRRRRTAWSFDSGSEQGGIFRSKDGGKTWTKLTNGLPRHTGRIGLDVYLKDPRILYAVVESEEGGGYGLFDDRSRSGGIFRSEDGGETWKRAHGRVPRAFYFSEVRIDPTDDQRIYLLGWVIEVSDDGGKSFLGGFTKKPHVDMHAMVVDPQDRDHLIIGNDGGVYQSFDRGKTWDFLNNIPAGQFYNLAYDMSEPYRVGGGLQDNGTWIGPSSTNLDTGSWPPGTPSGGITNADWRMVMWGDGFHLAFDPQDPNILYAESQGGNLGRVNLKTGKMKSLQPKPQEGQPRFRFNWNSPFFISPHNPTTVYFGGSYVFKLTERGDKWQRISGDLSTRDITKVETVGSEAETHGTVVSLAESPLQAGLLWAGTDDGLIHVTFDDGKKWTNVTPKAVNGWYIAKIEPSHHDKQTAYVAVDGHRSDNMDPLILMTTDSGKTWKNITSDLPKGWSVRVVREDLKNPKVLYAGTENAVYTSINQGADWIRLNGKSLPPAPAYDILQHAREMDLIVGTHGRSIYILDDASPLSQLTEEVIKSDLHLFEPQPARPQYKLPYEGFWSERFFLAPNPPAGAKITYWIKAASDDDVSITVEDEKGNAVRKLTGPNKPGLNRVTWDLQREEAERVPNEAEEPGEPIFVPAGKYKVTVTQGKHKMSKHISVLAAPK